MSYVRKLGKKAVEARKEYHKKSNTEHYRGCASFMFVEEPRHKPIYAAARLIRHLEHRAPSAMMGKLEQEYPHITPQIGAACYASWSYAKGHQPIHQLSLPQLRRMDNNNGQKVFPKSDVMLSRVVNTRAPKYIIIFKSDEHEVHGDALTVYNLLLKEKWIASVLDKGSHSYKKHQEHGLILEVGDHTLQRLFGAALALRCCGEHGQSIRNTYPALLKEGFPPHIAARLCLYLKYRDPGQWVPAPTGHGFCNAEIATDEVWASLLKDDWEPKWTQKIPWNNPKGHSSFQLNIATSNPDPMAGMNEEWFKRLGGGFGAYRGFDMQKLKDLYNAA